MKTRTNNFTRFKQTRIAPAHLRSSRLGTAPVDRRIAIKMLVLLVIGVLIRLPMYAQGIGHTPPATDPINRYNLWLPTYAALLSDEINNVGTREIRLLAEPCMSSGGCRLMVEFQNPFPGGITIMVRTSAGTTIRTTSANDPLPMSKQVVFELVEARAEISEIVSIFINPNGTGYNNLNPLQFADGGTEVIAVILDQSAYRPRVIKKVELESNPQKTELKESLQIFPNPTSGVCQVSFNGYGNLMVAVTDLMGHVVARKMLYPGKTERLDLSDLSPGVYFLKEEPLEPSDRQSSLPTFKIVVQ